MKCPGCESSNVVVKDTLHHESGDTFRYRRCLNCKRPFRTIETVIFENSYESQAYSEAYAQKHNKKNT